MILSLISGLAVSISAVPHFKDVAAEAGLGGINSTRVKFVDLNQDGKADIVLSDAAPPKHRVFLNRTSDGAVKFEEVANPRLPAAAGSDCIACADLDGDGIPDAILTRYLDVKNEKFVPPPEPSASCWMKGNGDGTFGEPHLLTGATRGTTAAISVGDVNRDGKLDLFLGLWYKEYGKTNDAYCNDLLISSGGEVPTFTRAPLPSDGVAYEEEKDLGGRPTYGLMILPRLEPATARPALLELSYGRRWNRLWTQDEKGVWKDLAPALKIDGDEIRHGVYPPEAKRENEKPFRSNGNNFDAALADVDGDGKVDLFLSMITHWWAGESSDRSRFLINKGDHFETPAQMNVDRIPKDPAVHWNQGDIFGELADFDEDGRIDLLLSSGEYPDKQMLRLFLQQENGSFKDVTVDSGIDHEGSAQISLADVDGDGDLDILVGQTFNRLTAEQTKGRTPRVRLFLNDAHQSGSKSVILRLKDATTGNHAGLGAMATAVRKSNDKEVSQTHVLIGVGGCSGKQHDFVLHFGLANASEFEQVTLTWPDGDVQELGSVKAGTHVIERKK